MKQKLLHALATAVLLILLQTAALCAGEGTVSWTQAAAVCYVSDAHYYTEDGQTAFVAGGLTAVPEGTRVYLTLSPRTDGGAPMRLLADAYMDFGDAWEPLEPVGELSQDGGGEFSFTMRPGTAQLVVSCAPLYAVDCAAAQVEGQGGVTVLDAQDRPTLQAAEGDILTLCVQPGAEYALGEGTLAVTDGAGESVPLDCEMGGRYRFVMPAGAVSVSAAFAPAAPIVLPSGVMCELSGEYAYDEPLRALPGSEVALKVSPIAEDERIRRGTQALEADGESLAADEWDIDEQTGGFTCSVTMPEGKLTVRAEVGRLCRIETDGTVRVLADDMATPVATCCEGELVYALVRLPDGYDLKDGLLAIEVGEGVAAPGQRRLESDAPSEARICITAPAGSMTLSPVLGALHSIRNLQPQGLGVIQTYPSGSVPSGSTVTVALLPAEGWRAREDSISICSAGSHVEVARAENGCFEMPSCDCEISAVFEPAPLGVELPGDGCFELTASYTLSASGAVDAPADSGVPAGALVRVAAQARAGCSVQGLYMAADGGEPQLIGEGAQATFVMPAADVAVYALCADGSHALPELAVRLAAARESATQENPAQAGTEALSADRLPCGASVVTEERNLRLRALSDTQSEIVDTYASGTRVTVEELSVDGEWARVTVDADGKSGWMKAQYLMPDAELPEAQILITVTLPQLRITRPYLVEQERANENGALVFKHIVLL